MAGSLDPDLIIRGACAGVQPGQWRAFFAFKPVVFCRLDFLKEKRQFASLS
jgi:hypothetical protein